MHTLLALLFALFLAPTAPRDDFALREAWIGKLHVGPFEAVMQFRVEADAAGATRAFFDSLSEQRTDFVAQWRIEGEQLCFDVEEVGAHYRGTLDATRAHAEGTFEQGGRELPLALDRSAKVYEPVYKWETRAQRPKAPFPYASEEVRFRNERDGLELAGTLTLPAGEGRHPAVVLISGSGQQDRDETLMEHKPFLVIADYLGRHGIAVLRYDDRGSFASGGDFGPATTADFAHDASAAVDFLQRDARIDPARIALCGHSEGGLVAPLVAVERTDLAGIVLLAGPGISCADIVREQSVSIPRSEGAGPAELQLQQAVLGAVVEAVQGARDGSDLTAAIQSAVAEAVAKLPEAERALASESAEAFRGQLTGFTTPWFRYFVKHDPLAVLRRVHCPVLALAGSKDVQVYPPARNLAGIASALAEGGNSDHETRELPGLNHMFQRCSRGSISEILALPETFDPAALEVLEHWLSGHLRAPAR
ncbi:MAG: alpha/beta fold hydrolase [Planctomycetes bacterium]|nr:alpha/beta fold hydrolase [Planctomycetota bacterium]